MTSTVDTFESVNPATGEPVGTFSVHDEAAVRSTVDRARTAAAWWDSLGFAGRAARLRIWQARLANRSGELAELIHRETGKPVDDAMIELASAVEHVHWAPANAARVLGRRKVRPGVLVANLAASVEYQPYGVVGVIGPWNYPVFTPMGSIVYALAAGNAVVFKPSEHTPAVGQWLVDSFAAVVPEKPVLQLITGAGSTGAALCRSGVDKLAFTGSTATAKKIMATCAETLTPVLLECGGKDALIVDADADVDAAATAALWGGMANGGQTCIGIERVYAVDAVYDEFVAALTAKARTLRPGDDRTASYGPATVPAQLDVIRRHVAGALDRGGRALVGGADAVRPPYAYPTVLVDVPEDAEAVTQETFGPTLTVARVADADEAVERANATGYGLGAAVFAKADGEDIARRIRSGMASVNSVLGYAGVGALPFGGVGDSGFGRIHGDDGLREFARTKAITRQRFPAPIDVTRFDRKPWAIKGLGMVLRSVYGRAPRP
ncbi:MAG TPA: aldehyde dehydrogenase family protein [Mycobacteriales bacterium]|nr:aldehyde dehydrogenase family protein [Mycobacteriales bacterium]